MSSFSAAFLRHPPPAEKKLSSAARRDAKAHLPQLPRRLVDTYHPADVFTEDALGNPQSPRQVGDIILGYISLLAFAKLWLRWKPPAS
ncbi:hypothetical protein KSP39_PZI014876 [Platanthera zijinensis]|uniref:Uncharacterized protein n=1 Tax=Platanthera zijinensis TaxID=2320716 RepID=A0AAP0G1Y6_9ASPA